MPHLPQKLNSQSDFAKAFDQVYAEADALEAKIITNFESRDMAVCADLWQRMADLYTAMGEHPELFRDQEIVFVRTNGQTVKFPNIDSVANWIVEKNYDNSN